MCIDHGRTDIDMAKECISSKGVVYLYKYIFFPLFVGFFALGILIAISDSTASFKYYLLLFVIIVPLLGISFYLFFSTQIIYIDEVGIYFKGVLIQWSQIDKIKFLKISPPLVLFKYLKHRKKGSVRTILPYSQLSVKKSRILDYKKRFEKH